MASKAKDKSDVANLSDFVLWLESFPQVKNGDTQNRILKLLENVEQICSVSTKQALSGVDFDRNDCRYEKLEAIISELRSVVFLKEKGFINSRLQERCLDKKHFDISAVFANKKYAIEVACLTQKNSRAKIKGVDCYRLDEAKFIKSLKTLALRKKPQLETSNADHRKLLIFVINRTPERELYCLQDYGNILHSLSDLLCWGNDYYFGVVTGVSDKDLIHPDIN